MTLRIGPERYGTIRCFTENVESLSKDLNLSLSFACTDVPKLDVASQSDPFFVIYRRVGQQICPIYQSEARVNTAHPNWTPISTTLGHLCNGNMGKKLLIKLFDWDSPTSKTEIGAIVVRSDEINGGSTFNIPHNNSIRGQKETKLYILDKKMEYTGDSNLKLEEIEQELLKHTSEIQEPPPIQVEQCIIL